MTFWNEHGKGCVARLVSMATRWAICTKTARNSPRPSGLVEPYSVRSLLLRAVGVRPEQPTSFRDEAIRWTSSTVQGIGCGAVGYGATQTTILNRDLGRVKRAFQNPV